MLYQCSTLPSAPLFYEKKLSLFTRIKRVFLSLYCFFGSIIFRVDGNFPPTLF
nr:MAG TPA: hypothetical protein [Caudoviricetes sp.]